MLRLYHGDIPLLRGQSYDFTTVTYHYRESNPYDFTTVTYYF